MGIESEQLVFDYLSRVGDLAHSTSMTAAERARLVGELRTRIERQRAEAEDGQSTPTVKKILKRIGKPEDVVASAVSGEVHRPTVPEQRDSSSGDTGSRHAPTSASSIPETAAAPPHLAGIDELTAEESDPNWWRGDASPYTKGLGGQVDGFTGGIEIPEMLKRPPRDGGQDGRPTERARTAPEPSTKSGRDPDPVSGSGSEPKTRKGLLARLRPAKGALPDSGVPRVGGPVELFAALVLVAGAVLGNLIALGVGWVLAWWSPRLSHTEGKWAALGMPGVVAGAGVVWLWGRVNRKWGDSIGEGEMGDVLNETYPWVLRGAAFASALFLIWRSRRRA